jgi:hypothetical protein
MIDNKSQSVHVVIMLLCALWMTNKCHAADDPPVLNVTQLSGEIHLDGKLDEACYKQPPTVADFVVAGAPASHPQPTRAWLFWQPERLVFAFEVVDQQIVAAGPSQQEHDVDAQDRVELFLWSGRKTDTYYCIEVGARGAVHDYAARFYREFDDAWAPAALQVAVTRTRSGYCVEAELPRAAVEAAGFALRAGEQLRGGLFRADFQPAQPDHPTWICWVDARGPKPDFHVAESFGTIRLVDRTERTTRPHDKDK